MTSKGLTTTNFKYMKTLIEKIKSKFCGNPLLVIPAVSGLAKYRLSQMFKFNTKAYWRYFAKPLL